MKTIAALVTLCMSFSLAFAQAPKKEAPKKEAKKSLYDRLGGQTAVEAVVKEFAGKVLADDRVNKKFAKSDADRVVKNLTDFVCKATGGPCKYTGFDMKKAHKNMGVTQGEWDAVVEDLVATLDKFKVPEEEKKELLGKLGPLSKDVIADKKSKDTGTALPDKFKPAPALKPAAGAGSAAKPAAGAGSGSAAKPAAGAGSGSAKK